MTTIQFRRGTDAEAAANNPVLARGEPGWTDEGTFKIGDGVTPWNDLDPVGEGAHTALLDYAQLDNGTALVLSTTSTSFEDTPNIDPVTFTAPVSGTVEVVVSGTGDHASAGQSLYVNVRDASGDVTAGMLAHTGTDDSGFTRRRIVTGLTPGDECTWRLGYKSSTSGSGARLRYGGDYGPLLFAVYSAPA